MSVGQRILKEYGALFVARGGATPPNTASFQKRIGSFRLSIGLSKSSETLGGFNIELQSAAMKGLKEAIAEAKQNNLDYHAARRGFGQKKLFGNSRHYGRAASIRV
ncbi:MAG: hypothetical protein WKF73_16365 [Nocardioidaceae bacterium]